MTGLLLGVPSPAFSQHVLSGVSTGYMTEMRGDWPRLVEAAARASSLAVELSALHERELPDLDSYLASQPTLPFEYVVAHGPTKGRKQTEDGLVDALERLACHVEGVVMHPDLMTDVHAYAELGRKLIVENLDSRKSMGHDVDDLYPIFESLPDAGLCLDVAHAKDVDPSMATAHRLLDEFGPRLRQVHLSSLDPGGHHVELTDVDSHDFASVLERCRDVPWIFEAPLPAR